MSGSWRLSTGLSAIISGIIQPEYKTNKGEAENEESEEDEENDSYLDFEVTKDPDNAVQSRNFKMTKVRIKDDDGKIHTCSGKFPLTQTFWRVTVKVKNGWLKSAPSYAIRTDGGVQAQKLVMIFLTECFPKDKFSEGHAHDVTACFEAFCHLTGIESSLTFIQLEQNLKKYIELEKLEGCCLRKLPTKYGKHTQMDHSKFVSCNVLDSDLGVTVLRAVSHPILVSTLSELLPYSFVDFIHKLELKQNKTICSTVLQEANEMATNRPWEFVFKDIIYTKLKLQGTEAALFAYESAGYVSRTPQREKDAIYIYEVLKTDARKDGHVYISFERLRNCYHFRKLGYHINSEQRWQESLDYLESNRVIKRETFDRTINIFLHCNWQAEVDIVKGFERIFRRNHSQPLEWVVDYKSSDFEGLISDLDQLKALHLISSSPITVLSGKGGCGKTTVVTKLLQHLCFQKEMEINAIKKREEEEDLELLNITEEIEAKIAGLNHGLPNGCCDESSLYPNSCDVSHIPSTSRTFPACSSHKNPTHETVTCLTKTGKVPDNDLVPECENGDLGVNSLTAESKVSPGMNSHSSSNGHESREQPLGQGSLGSRQAGSKYQGRWSQHPAPEDSVETRHRKQVILDLIKILNQTKDVGDPLVEEYKKTILLTAPTGKAARLLGHKAKLPSATLHSVIMSWNAYYKFGETEEWTYSTVEILVVDECSLVSVRLFAQVMKILIKRANLRKVVLLGDVRQLPSIEAGNFLTDVFKTLKTAGGGHFSLSIELSTNHRSESELIVENAGKIATQIMPTFNEDKHFHLVGVSDDADSNEYQEAVRSFLRHNKEVQSDIDSQFVCFRRTHCKAVNELCCLHYNKHSTTTAPSAGAKGRADFRIGDKICLGKNNKVENFRELTLKQYIDHSAELLDAVKQTIDRKKNLNNKQKQTIKEVICSELCGGQKTDKLDSPQMYGGENTVKLDPAQALTLIESDDAVFESTISEIKEKDLQAQAAARERAKRERLRLAEEQKAAWKASRDMRPEIEKLCNGEVFFIMDEIYQEDRYHKQVRYLVLSDRDPICPRVVCASYKTLRKLCKIRHSWARTIHTFQGSETDTVVYFLGKAIPQNWQHVYTAITRGKKSVHIICNREELNKAVNKRDYPRRSRLWHRLKEMTERNLNFIQECKHRYQESFHEDNRKVTVQQPDVDEMDSGDSWVHDSSLEKTLLNATKDEQDMKTEAQFNGDLGQSTVLQASSGACGNSCDNDLNQETNDCSENEQYDFNIFDSFEDNEDPSGSSKEESTAQKGNEGASDFDRSSTPINCGNHNGEASSKEMLSKSAIELSFEEVATNGNSLQMRETMSSQNVVQQHLQPHHPTATSQKQLTPCRAAFNTGLHEEAQSHASPQTPKKRPAADAMINTPFRESFTQSLTLADNDDVTEDEESPIKSARRSLNV